MTAVLEELKQKLQMYTVQKDQAQVNFQQLTGAIHVITETIKSMEAASSEELPCEPGGCQDGETQLPSAE